MYLPMRSHTLYIAIKTRAYLKNITSYENITTYTHINTRKTRVRDLDLQEKLIIKEREMDGINYLLAEETVDTHIPCT